jgi:hypothetical protein
MGEKLPGAIQRIDKNGLAHGLASGA